MDDIDRLMEQRRAAPIPVSDDLMARIMADAAREQPRTTAPMPALPIPSPIPSPVARLWQITADLFGGGGVLAGLATAACAGVYIGFAQPSVLGDVTLALAGSSAIDQLDFMPSLDPVLTEE